MMSDRNTPTKRIDDIETILNKTREEKHQNELDHQKVVLKLKALEEKVERIDGNLAKAVWIVLGSVIVGFMGIFTIGGFFGGK
jgi:hypothetical protein